MENDMTPQKQANQHRVTITLTKLDDLKAYWKIRDKGIQPLNIFRLGLVVADGIKKGK